MIEIDVAGSNRSFYSSISAALGLDHHRVTFAHEGRAASLTDAEVTGAKIIPALLA